MGERLICTNCGVWFGSQDDQYPDWRAIIEQGGYTEIFCCKKCEDEHRERDRKYIQEVSKACSTFMNALRRGE